MGFGSMEIGSSDVNQLCEFSEGNVEGNVKSCKLTMRPALRFGASGYDAPMQRRRPHAMYVHNCGASQDCHLHVLCLSDDLFRTSQYRRYLQYSHAAEFTSLLLYMNRNVNCLELRPSLMLYAAMLRQKSGLA